MKKRGILRTAAAIWAVFVFIVAMTLLAPFIALPFLLGKVWGTRISYRFMKLWAWAFTFPMLFIRYKSTNYKRDRHLKKAIYVANHTSFLDSTACVHTVDKPMKPLGKIEMTKVPIFGWLYRSMVILVDRSDKQSKSKSFVEMVWYLERNISILIYPEGSVNKGDWRQIQPFKQGAFTLAIQTGVPIVPLVVHNAGNLLGPFDSLFIKPGVITIDMLEPVSPENYTKDQANEFADYIRGLMQDRLTQLCDEGN